MHQAQRTACQAGHGNQPKQLRGGELKADLRQARDHQRRDQNQAMKAMVRFSVVMTKVRQARCWPERSRRRCPPGPSGELWAAGAGCGCCTVS